ncbi:MAG: hemerythrin family protein [Bdellovibrionales bacterium]|nr:hemerythrin family protein [Bdellovibrionales bacterium]
MQKIEWSDEVYGLGIKRIDDQHKQLLNLINALSQIGQSDKPVDPEFVKKVVNTLVDYTKNHFADEEKLLKRLHYPDYPNHSLAHRRFISQVEEFRDAFQNSPDSKVLTNKIATFLSDWLTRHILVEDKEYVKYMFSGSGPI